MLSIHKHLTLFHVYNSEDEIYLGTGYLLDSVKNGILKNGP